MSFTNFDLLLAARQHRQELAKHADVHRLIRQGGGRRRRRSATAPRNPQPRGRPDAA